MAQPYQHDGVYLVLTKFRENFANFNANSSAQSAFLLNNYLPSDKYSFRSLSANVIRIWIQRNKSVLWFNGSRSFPLTKLMITPPCMSHDGLLFTFYVTGIIGSTVTVPAKNMQLSDLRLVSCRPPGYTQCMKGGELWLL